MEDCIIILKHLFEKKLAINMHALEERDIRIMLNTFSCLNSDFLLRTF